MGMITNLLLMLFTISFFLYLGGYQSGLLMMMDNWGGAGAGIGSDAFAGVLIGSLIAGFAGAAAAGAISGGFLGSQSVIYTIPAGFITTFLGSFMLLPISFIFEPAMPLVLKIFLGGFLYICLISAVISFIRGVDA